MTTTADLDNLEAVLLNRGGKTALHERFRALFTLKSLKNLDAIRIITNGFQDQSALLKHELAYCLGQMKDPRALTCLEQVLNNKSEDAMVRHEAAEAMAAISSESSLATLRQHLSDPERAVRETCEIAIAKIEWDHSEEGKKHSASRSMYTSIDPAPPASGLLSSQTRSHNATETEIAVLRHTLLSPSLPLFERYRAMFALRNIGNDAAVDALAAGFTDDSDLFKHEIAFVFGQLLSPHSVPALIKVLEDSSEADMVRHEAAEALGGIGTPAVLPHLRKWLTREDSPTVVKESCQVAIDMWEYENSDQFQYANGLPSTTHIALAV